MIIHDRYGRPVRNLRISVTPACNLNCIYCHREGIYSFYHCIKGSTNKRLLTPSEIKTIVEILVKYGVREVKLTGGEPLLRKDITEIISKIREIKEIEDVSLVTNGHFLGEMALDLKKSGLDRVNVSLPALDPEKYSFITGYKGGDGVSKVIDGIKKAISVGLNPVKINVVVLKGINHNEINKFIELGYKLGAVIQFIELQDPNGFNSEFFRKYYYPLDKLERDLSKVAEHIYIREMHNRKRYMLSNGVEVEVVRPMFNRDFCMHCNRIRLTHFGEFKPCLMRDDNHVKINGSFSNIEEIEKAFIEAVKRREPYFD